MTYRDSPAAEQSGTAKGGPEAGDRDPYGRFEAGPAAGTDLFDTMKGTDHHLLLFEGPGGRSDATERRIRGPLDRYGVSVRLHRVPAGDGDLHRKYGAGGPAPVMVRPDGHAAFRGSPARPEELAAYLARWFERGEAGSGLAGQPRDGFRSPGVRTREETTL